MPEFSISFNDNTYVIHVNGVFNFKSCQKFLKSIEIASKTLTVEKIVIDCTKVSFIDSSALGVLLIAQDQLQKKSLPFVVRGVNGQVKRMLSLTKLDEILEIIK